MQDQGQTFILVVLQLFMVASCAAQDQYSCNAPYQPGDFANRGRTHVPFDCVAGTPSTCPRSWKAGITAGRSTSPPLIDAEFIKCMEGFSECGYVPIIEKTGTVVGDSGVTIGIGIDLGSRDHDSLTATGVEISIIDKLEPYFGLQRDNAACAAIELPLNLTNDEATALSTAIKNEIVTSVAMRYDAQRDSDSMLFNSLPRGVRTAIASVLFQYGSESRVPMFWGYVTGNDWEEAVQELRNFGDDFPTRRNYEADILEAAVSQCSRSLDAVFLLDESGSINAQDFQLSLDFIEGIINIFQDNKIGGENGTNFGLSLFSGNYRSAFFLSTYDLKNDYLSAVDNTNKISGGTYLGLALTQINTDQFDESRGLRSEEQGIPRILIVLTDGKSSDSVTLPSQTIRNNNIVIYAIGIGNYDGDQLNAMASSASHIYTLSSFQTLADFAGTLTAASCHESRPVNLETKIRASVRRESYQYYSFSVVIGRNLKVQVNDTSGTTLVYASRDNPHPFEFDKTFGFMYSNLQKTLIISPANVDMEMEDGQESSSQSLGTVYISVTAETESATFVLEGTICDPVECTEGTNEVVTTVTEPTMERQTSEGASKADHLLQMPMMLLIIVLSGGIFLV